MLNNVFNIFYARGRGLTTVQRFSAASDYRVSVEGKWYSRDPLNS